VTFEYLDGRSTLVSSDSDWLHVLRIANPELRKFLPPDRGRVYLEGRRRDEPQEENDEKVVTLFPFMKHNIFGRKFSVSSRSRKHS